MTDDHRQLSNATAGESGPTSNRSLDVLQVNKLYHPEVGGIETAVREIATGLAHRGHKSRVLAASAGGRGEQVMMDSVTVTKTASLGRLQSVPLSPSFPLRLYQLSRPANIVHHHIPNPLGIVSHLLTPSHGGRTVVTYHSDIVRQQRALRVYGPILRSFLCDVDQILVTSPRLLQHSSFLKSHSEKCTVVPLSIDIEEYLNPPGDEFDLPVPSDRPVILVVGRLNYYKGVEYLIDAMHDVDASLLVVGDGERRSSLEQRAMDHGIADDVEFMGKISNQLLHHCYDIADVFVLPSVEPSEAFGIVQLEAMAHETPVVNTNLPTGVPWVSKHGETGLTVPPRDSEAMADAINELLADEIRRNALGEAARDRVVEKFGQQRMLSSIESVYDELLGK